MAAIYRRATPFIIVLSMLTIFQSSAISAAQRRGVPALPQEWRMLFSDDFEKGPSELWRFIGPDASAFSWIAATETGNSFIHNQGQGSTVVQDAFWKNYRLRARVRITAGMISIRLREASALGASYSVGWNLHGINLFRNESGRSQQLALTNAELAQGRWYQLEALLIDNSIRVSVDGVQMFVVNDSVPLPAGSISFFARPDDRLDLDDVEIFGKPAAEDLTWVRMGGPLGGVGYDIRHRWNDPNVLLVTDNSTGVSYSVDNGQTWIPSNQGILTRGGTSGDAVPIFCLTIDPNNPSIVWAGTQNARGVYKSVDGGKTWALKINGIVEQNGITFRGFSIEPRNSNVVYAAGEISSTLWAGQSLMIGSFDRTKGVVYKSIDGGENWSAVWRGENLARYVYIDPRNTSVLYISTGFWDRMGAQSDVDKGILGGVGIIKSVDGGAHWRVLNEANGLGNLFVSSLFMNPENPDILIAGTGNNLFMKDQGVYLTVDGGETWRATLLSNSEITAVKFAPSNPKIAYAAGTCGFYRSEDGGVTWARLAGLGMGGNSLDWGPPGVRLGIPIDMMVDPRDPNRVMVNSYVGGNFLSEDGGRTWTNASKGYTGVSLSDIAIDPTDHRFVYAIGRSGPFRSANGGSDWEGLSYIPSNINKWFTGGYGFPEWYSVAVDPSNPAKVLFSDEMLATIFLSTNHGLDWQIAYRQPFDTGTSPRIVQGFKAFVFAPSNPQVIYAGSCGNCRSFPDSYLPSFGVFKSPDGGATWKPANDAFMSTKGIFALAVDPGNPDTVYAGVAGSGIYKTMDGGISWKPANTGLSFLDVRSIAIDPANTNVIYAGTEGAALFKSTDAGAHWASSSAGMTSTGRIRDIVLDPTNSQTVYAAEIGQGVYRSQDGGTLWIGINQGLRNHAAKALAISSDGGTLYVATDGEGVFRLDIKPFERRLRR
jgi:photosystem II stability/assembly factor-like uncharacterized protein